MQRDPNGNDIGVMGDPDGVYAACYEDDLYRAITDIDIPTENILSGLYPNPFQSLIVINLELATEIDLKVIVINQSNQIVATILDELKDSVIPFLMQIIAKEFSKSLN